MFHLKAFSYRYIRDMRNIVGLLLLNNHGAWCLHKAWVWWAYVVDHRVVHILIRDLKIFKSDVLRDSVSQRLYFKLKICCSVERIGRTNLFWGEVSKRQVYQRESCLKTCLCWLIFRLKFDGVGNWILREAVRIYNEHPIRAATILN